MIPIPAARKGEHNKTIRAYGQQKYIAIAKPAINVKHASMITIATSVVSPFNKIISPDMTAVIAPGARLSWSNHESCLNMTPLMSNFLTLAVSYSP